MMMKKLMVLCVVMVGAMVLGGCAQAPSPQVSNALMFTPATIAASDYEAKVDNVVIIMDDSNSMNEAVNGHVKSQCAAGFLTALNQSVPELGYNVELISFGPGNAISGNGNLAAYSTKALCAALGQVAPAAGNSSKPLAKAIDAAAADLKDVSGKSAVLIISDGDRLYDAPQAAAESLAQQLGDKLCIYTVQIGMDEQGAAALKQLASAAPCGSSVSAADLASAAAMEQFVTEVFCAKKAAPAPVPAAVVADSDGDGVPDSIDACPNTPVGAHVNARGCWAYDAKVLFAFDSSVINPDAFAMLDNGVEVMLNNPDIKVEIDGHTDSRGPAAYNQKLSEARALAVANYFISHGVEAARISAVGFGETMPVASNDTEAGRAQNRRVELKVVR